MGFYTFRWNSHILCSRVFLGNGWQKLRFWAMFFDQIIRLEEMRSVKKEYVAFRDPQQTQAACRCSICGREVYGPEGICIYCQAYGDDPEGNQ